MGEERERKRGRLHPKACSGQGCQNLTQWPGSLELNPGLLCGQQEPSDLDDYHCFPRATLVGSWKWEPNVTIELKFSNRIQTY